MGRYTGPKVKLSRRVGAPIADIPKHTAKELTLPGMHALTTPPLSIQLTLGRPLEWRRAMWYTMVY